MFWLPAICIFALSYWVWTIYALEQNVKKAKAIGMPFVRVQVYAMNVFWLVFEPYFCAILDFVGIGQGDFMRYAKRGWFWREKDQSHLQHGKIWSLCSPVDVLVNVADLKAIQEIFARRHDFIRPNHLYAMMDIYGPSVATVGPKSWQRQRKILAAPFHEGTMELVWNESLDQAKDMLKAWTNYGEAGAPGVTRDTRTLALDVLAATGFRRSYKFKSSAEIDDADSSNYDYRDALRIVLDNALTLMVLPRISWTLPFLPCKLRSLGTATKRFESYMHEMLSTEKNLLAAGEPGTGTLMTSFVRALNDGKKPAGAKGATEYSSSQGLSIKEVLGNIFAINFAGHDTTANTLSFSMLLLAAHPEVQEWLGEELKALAAAGSEMEYKALFPKLNRCMAVLHETLRLYPPVYALPKYSPTSPQLLPLSDGTVLTIPAGVTVIPSVLAVHMLPEYWGEDAREWKPQRWIKNDSPADVTKDEFQNPQPDAYFPWSKGVADCPGQKFSQVEFVAVVATLFRSHRVKPLLKTGESLKDAQKRLVDVSLDCDVELLLRVRDADPHRLVWESIEQ